MSTLRDASHRVSLQLNDLRELLYTAAVAHRAKVRLGAEVTIIDSAKHTVTLSSGEVLSADVIIGADGPSGPCRQVVLDDVESNSTSTDSASSTVKESDMNLYRYVENLFGSLYYPCSTSP